MGRLLKVVRIAAFAWKLPATISTVMGAIVIAWEYVQAAPPVIIALSAVGATMPTLAILLGIAIWLELPAAKGACTPRKLRFYGLPLKRVAWNFDNYLAGLSEPGRPISVTSFQTCFWITRGRGITPKAAYILSDRTGNRAEVLVECGNPYVSAEQIEFMPRRSDDKPYHCRIFFGDEGLTKEQFLGRFDGFDFVFEYDNAKFRRHFPRREIEELFECSWRNSNLRREPTPRLKQSAR